jgi:hypothetical protein
MNTQTAEKPSPGLTVIKADRPLYETPRIQMMSEKDILNTFQITQSMGVWWAASSC